MGVYTDYSLEGDPWDGVERRGGIKQPQDPVEEAGSWREHLWAWRLRHPSDSSGSFIGAMRQSLRTRTIKSCCWRLMDPADAT
jgi:hypothetical protein